MEMEPRRRSILGKHPKANIAVFLILLYEFLNGFAFSSLSANVVSYATDHLGLVPSTTLIIGLVFSGVSYTTPIVGGLVGDIKLGSYWTIFAGNCLYLVGMVILMVITGVTQGKVELPVETKIILYLIGLVLIALGQGFITVQILPLGAEQIKERGVGTIQRYYRWCTFSFNLGKLLAYLPLPYILQKAEAEEESWVLCTIQLIFMCLAAFVFIMGKRWYIIKPAEGSLKFKQMFIAIKQCALLRPRIPYPHDDADRREWERWYTAHMIRPIIFIFAIFSIGGVYEAIYFQMFTTYPLQGQNLTDLGANLPGSFMTSFDPLPVMFIVPAIEIYFWCAKRKNKRHLEIHPLRRIGLGLICAVLSALAAGIISTCKRHFSASAIAIFWQIPQYMILGVSEVIFFASGFEFCFLYAPRGLAGFTTAMFLGVGSCFGFILYLAFIPLGTTTASVSEIPHRTLEALFYTLGGLMLLFLGPYALLVKRFTVAHEQLPKEPEWKDLPSITRDFSDTLESG